MKTPTGTTCARQCEATAYQIEMRQRDAEIERLRAERDRLAKVIEDAPHTEDCATLNEWLGHESMCNCWKSRTSGEEE